MDIVHSLIELRKVIAGERRQGHTVGFVPTMGNLHEGHLTLIDAARKASDLVICSVFVNPLQFGENEDFDAYPRTLEEDSRLLEARGCHILFAPTVADVYPGGMQNETRVHVPGLTKHHCGASREGHFDGVTTVVSKLFNMVQPDIAVFGEKDYQQLTVIRKMVKDLCFPINIIGFTTSREDNGLARSSRNNYLSLVEKQEAVLIYQALQKSKVALEKGGSDFASLRNNAINLLEQNGFIVDYFNFASAETLEPANENEIDIVIMAAAHLGSTRLIDNICVTCRR
jgi:pantoate--beta-alanine ligase